MNKHHVRPVALLLIVVFLSVFSGGCGQAKEDRSLGKDENLYSTEKIVLASEFGPYRSIPVDEQPCLEPYQAATELGNIENGSRFSFSEEAKAMLVKNGFVVLPQMGTEFFMIYEMNRYSGTPNFVTTDAMLHNYHLFFNHLLKTVEEEQLRPELQKLNTAMLTASKEQYQVLKESPWENAAKRNLAFFNVASCLLDPNTKIAKEVQTEVETELQLIKEQNTTTASPVMNMGAEPGVTDPLQEDYTQYIPRGHYTRSDDLKTYFQSMMWNGRMTFRLKNEDETRSAILMTLALEQHNNRVSWEKIYRTTNFFVGQSDDPGCSEYSGLINEVYGPELSLQELSTNENKWQTLLQKASELKGPMINSIPIFDPTIQPDREKEITGFRFMGQRYTIDADIFQRLIYREVKENDQGDLRLLPKGLDIPAAMGSSEASNILKEMGEFSYQNYSENMSRMQKHLAGLDASTWHQNLYWNWMNTLTPLTREIQEGCPSFMQNQAWQRKELNTFLASWTELKHDTILYAKQCYAECGGCIPDNIDDRGYVEPNPHLYARLAALSAMTRDGLQSQNIINERDVESLNRMETLALNLKAISEKELQGQSLTEEEYELIRSFGGQLEHFWLEALRDQESTGRSQLLADNPAMLVADVATAPPDTVLEEGSGFIQSIYAVVPVEGKLRITKGAIYSYYEFPWSASDRLTDEKWREMVFNERTPDAPEWTRSFKCDGTCQTMQWEENQ